MICRRRLIAAFLWAGCAGLWPAAAGAIPPGVSVTQLVVDTWTTNDGLPQDRVQSITQTRDGLVWVGTEAGLARFDGHRFVVFSPPSLASLRNEAITALLGARDGSLWIGTLSGSLFRVASGHPATLTWEAPGKAASVWDLVEDEQGRLWVATGDGIYHVAGTSLVPVVQATGPVYALARAPGGAWWAGGRRGLFQWNGTTLRQFTAADGYRWGRISGLRSGPDGSLWVAARSAGLVRYHNGRWQEFSDAQGPIGNLARAVAVDRDGHAWVGTWNGLARVERNGFSPWAAASGRMPTGIDTIFEDRDGALWVGSMGGGLYRIRQGAIVTHSVTDGLVRDDLLAVCASRAGQVWTGTGDSGAMFRTADGWRRTGVKTGLDETALWSCASDRDGSVWLGSGAGLFRARGERVELVGLPGADPAPLILSLLATSAGDLWVAVKTGLLRIGANGSTTLELSAAAGIDQVLAEGPDGTIWLAGPRGLYSWRGAKATMYWGASDESHRPISMLADPDGTLWVGTAGAGLLRHRAGRATLLGRQAGLPDLTVAAVLDDGHGSLWLSTHAGLARVARERLNRATESTPLDPIVYTVRDGLRSHYSDERGQPAGAVTPDGRLWMATTRGLAEIDPSRLPDRSQPTGVFVDDISVDNRVLAAGEVAPAGRGSIQIRFSASGRISSPHVRFRYRLEGFDPDWIEAGRSRTAAYTNVPPGQYRFIVGAADESPEWGPDEASVSLVLLPHWYETIWFRGVAVVAVLGAAITIPILRARKARRDADALSGIVEHRTAALRESERRYRSLAEELDARVRNRTQALQDEIGERKRTEDALILARDAAEAAVRAKSSFLANMSHELRTPLNAVIGYSELLIEEASEQRLESFEKDLSRIRGAGQHLLALVSDVLEMARIEADRVQLAPVTFVVHDLVKEVVDSVMALAGRNGNSLHAIEAPGLGPMNADVLRVKQVLLNLLSNACKFTQNGDITLEVRQYDEDGAPWTTFVVRDTGIGIAPSDLPKLFAEFSQLRSPEGRNDGVGLGLAISQRLCVSMGGTIAVTSEIGRGTVFTVHLPTGPAERPGDP